MKSKLLSSAALLLLLTTTAEARYHHYHRSSHCGQGQIKRVSMGICVSKGSRLARGFTGYVRHSRQLANNSRRYQRHNTPRVEYSEPTKQEDRAPLTVVERVNRAAKQDRSEVNRAPVEPAPVPLSPFPSTIDTTPKRLFWMLPPAGGVSPSP
jgi:hypothetical protein